MKLLKQAEYMAATGFTLHPTIAFRSGLGPYKPQVRINALLEVRNRKQGRQEVLRSVRQPDFQSMPEVWR